MNRVIGYKFLSFARKYKKQLLDTGLDSLKTVFQKALHKTGEFLGNKTAGTVAKSNNGKIVKRKHIIDGNPRNVEEIIIPPEREKKY